MKNWEIREGNRP